MVLLVTIIVLYISIFLFFRAYEIGVKRRLELITDWSNTQLPNPQSHRASFIKLYLTTGVTLILITMILVIFKVQLVNWWALGFVVIFAASYRNYICKHARGEINLKKPNDSLVKLANYHIVLLVLFLLFFLIVLLAGLVLLINGKGDNVWKLLIYGALGVGFGIKLILIKYDKNKSSN